MHNTFNSGTTVLMEVTLVHVPFTLIYPDTFPVEASTVTGGLQLFVHVEVLALNVCPEGHTQALEVLSHVAPPTQVFVQTEFKRTCPVGQLH